MKKTILFGLAVLAGSLVMAQSSKEVSWTCTAKKVSDKVYEVHMTATIGAGYHLYAQKTGEGPVPTSFSWTINPLVVPEGPIKEVGKLVKKMEPAFGTEVQYYEKTVEFVQVVTLKSKAKTSFAGTVEFMVCNDTQCLPPADVQLKVNVGG